MSRFTYNCYLVTLRRYQARFTKNFIQFSQIESVYLQHRNCRRSATFLRSIELTKLICVSIFIFFYLKEIAKHMHNDGVNLPKIINRLRFFRPAQSDQTTADRVQEVQILQTLATSDSYEISTTAHPKKTKNR